MRTLSILFFLLLSMNAYAIDPRIFPRGCFGALAWQVVQKLDKHSYEMRAPGDLKVIVTKVYTPINHTGNVYPGIFIKYAKRIDLQLENGFTEEYDVFFQCTPKETAAIGQRYLDKQAAFDAFLKEKTTEGLGIKREEQE